MSALNDAVAKVVFDLSQLTEKSWFAVVRRAMLESQEIGRREARAELAALRATVARRRDSWRRRGYFYTTSKNKNYIHCQECCEK